MRNEKTHFPMPGLACPISQPVAFPHEISLFGVGLRAYGYILTCSHRHGASYEPRDTRNQNVILSCGYGGNSHDQACGRDNVVDSPQDRCFSPPNSSARSFSECWRKRPISFLLTQRLVRKNVAAPTSGGIFRSCAAYLTSKRSDPCPPRALNALRITATSIASCSNAP